MSLGSVFWVLSLRTGLRTIDAIPLSPYAGVNRIKLSGLVKNHLSTQPAYTPEYFWIVVAYMLLTLATISQHYLYYKSTLFTKDYALAC
jgi:hypothetical protein